MFADLPDSSESESLDLAWLTRQVDGGNQYTFTWETNGNPDGAHLWIADSPQIPPPSNQPSSVAVTLSGDPACVTNAGPNLNQTFSLHPTYHVDAGDYVTGQMVDGADVAGFMELEYRGGNDALTATLNADNTWTARPSGR